MKNSVKRLYKAAEARNVEVIEKGEGHFRINGPLTVNYYPYSSKQTAYVDGTVKGRERVNPEQAVSMCFKTPKKVNGLKAKRKSSYKSQKKELFKTEKSCHWCHTPLTLDTATMEHIIPLDAGGLDHPMNRALACEPCNTKRGNKMPELKGEKMSDQNDITINGKKLTDSQSNILRAAILCYQVDINTQSFVDDNNIDKETKEFISDKLQEIIILILEEKV